MSAMTIGALACSITLFLIGSSTNPMYEIPPHYHLVLGGFAFGLA